MGEGLRHLVEGVDGIDHRLDLRHLHGRVHGFEGLAVADDNAAQYHLLQHQRQNWNACLRTREDADLRDSAA